MKWPTCKDINLVMERQGIEIDYCPECRGICLDRGELDKIIERSVPQASPSRDREANPERDRRDDKSDYQYKRKKPKSFLGDLFDF